MSTEQNLPALVVVNGAQKLTVTKLDGTTEEVAVGLVPLTKMGDYIEKVGDFAAFVELACNRPAGWVDSLTDDSAYAVDALFRKLNDPRCDRYLARQIAAVVNLKDLAKKHGASKNS